MELITRFRTPVITAVGVLVAVIVVYAAWISPEGSKLSSLHGKETQLQSQQLQLQAEIGTLKHDKAQMITNCQQLTKDLTEIPVTPSVDSFLQQVTSLAVAVRGPEHAEHQRDQRACNRWSKRREHGGGGPCLER